VIEDSFRNRDAILLFQRLTEAWDRHLLEREGVELQRCQMMKRRPSTGNIGASTNKNGDLPLYYFFNIAI